MNSVEACKGADLSRSGSLSNMSIENVAVPKDRVTTHNGGTQMQYQITGGQLPVVMCYLDEGESMITESGGMSWMSPNMEMQTTTGGGLGKMFSRMFSGEHAFQNIYTSKCGPGTIAFSSSFPGFTVCPSVCAQPLQLFFTQSHHHSSLTVFTSAGLLTSPSLLTFHSFKSPVTHVEF
jgi:hypothetical protein